MYECFLKTLLNSKRFGVYHLMNVLYILVYRQSNDNAVSKFLSKASFKSSKKDKSHSIWQYQREPIKKPLLRRTHLREELRRASCRSFLDIL